MKEKFSTLLTLAGLILLVCPVGAFFLTSLLWAALCVPGMILIVLGAHMSER